MSPYISVQMDRPSRADDAMNRGKGQGQPSPEGLKRQEGYRIAPLSGCRL